MFHVEQRPLPSPLRNDKNTTFHVKRPHDLRYSTLSFHVQAQARSLPHIQNHPPPNRHTHTPKRTHDPGSPTDTGTEPPPFPRSNAANQRTEFHVKRLRLFSLANKQHPVPRIFRLRPVVEPVSDDD